MVYFLLKAGACLDIKNSNSQTPLELAQSLVPGSDIESLLHEAHKILEWLTNLKLVEYYVNFLENEIKLNDLSGLTDHLLASMGISNEEHINLILTSAKECKYFFFFNFQLSV